MAERFAPFVRDAGELRFYGLEGKTLTLVWCRNRAATWQSELVDGVRPEVRKNVEIRPDSLVPGKRYSAVELYDPWSDVKTAVKLEEGAFVVPEIGRSVVIRLYN